MIRPTFLLAIPLLLSACGSEPETEDETATPAEVRETESDRLAERFADTAIVVNANGLGPKGAEPFRFSAPRAEVDASLADAFGSEPETGENAECGAGPMQFSNYGPLQVAYQDDRLAGWFLRPGEGVATADGIRPGATKLTGLKGERQVREIGSSLPGEFEYTSADYGTIRGFSEGDAITGLQAGLSCFFR